MKTELAVVKIPDEENAEPGTCSCKNACPLLGVVVVVGVEVDKVELVDADDEELTVELGVDEGDDDGEELGVLGDACLIITRSVELLTL